MNVKQLRARNLELARAGSFLSLFLAIAFALAACGGGGGSLTETVPQSTPTTPSTPSVLTASFANPVITLESGTPRAKALAATAGESGVNAPYGGADPLEAIRQLLDFAEVGYPQYFPKKQTTQVWEQYHYRRYPSDTTDPSKDTYVGVAYGVKPGDGTCEGCVYVMGGEFGPSPTYVGPLTKFITPVNILRYDEKVYALWTANWPFAVTKTGVTRVTNKTSSPGLLPYVNCWLASKPLSDGKVLANCLDNSGRGTGRHVLYINPVENALYDYSGSTPPDVVWLDVAHFDPAKPEWEAKAQVSDGWYFTSAIPLDPVTIRFQELKTGLVSVVKAGTFEQDSTVKLLVSYSK